MEWYWIVISFYSFYIFVLTIYYKTDIKVYNIKEFLLYIMVFVFLLLFLFIFTPIMWLLNMVDPYKLQFITQYKIYYAKPLTENHKTTLINLGFTRLDNWVDSNSGFNYSGYKKNYIIVQDNGRITVMYAGIIEREAKKLVKMIQDFPVEEKEKDEDNRVL